MAKDNRSSDLFSPMNARNLDKKRQDARSSRRIPYDCFNAIVKGDRVVCKRGYGIGRSKDGSMLLVTVLAGRSAKICQMCPDYDDDGEQLGE
jgi:hypothetical protein